mmetsp:Transcript_8273/g.20356  ORF Transcript_8273/g.20356 Transcript_8273/m.20356 type:complete len:270 (+) Transcript_8273:3067-3876(+)
MERTICPFTFICHYDCEVFENPLADCTVVGITIIELTVFRKQYFVVRIERELVRPSLFDCSFIFFETFIVFRIVHVNELEIGYHFGLLYPLLIRIIRHKLEGYFCVQGRLPLVIIFVFVLYIVVFDLNASYLSISGSRLILHFDIGAYSVLFVTTLYQRNFHRICFAPRLKKHAGVPFQMHFVYPFSHLFLYLFMAGPLFIGTHSGAGFCPCPLCYFFTILVQNIFVHVEDVSPAFSQNRLWKRESSFELDLVLIRFQRNIIGTINQDF